MEGIFADELANNSNEEVRDYHNQLTPRLRQKKPNINVAK